MSDRDNKIDKLFNKSFEGFDITPSEGVWESIKSKLDEEDSTDKIFAEPFKDYEVAPSESVWGNVKNALDIETYKRRVLWFQRIAAGLLLFIVGTGVYMWEQKGEDKKVIVESDRSYSENTKKIKDNKGFQNNNSNVPAVLKVESTKEDIWTNNTNVIVPKAGPSHIKDIYQAGNNEKDNSSSVARTDKEQAVNTVPSNDLASNLDSISSSKLVSVNNDVANEAVEVKIKTPDPVIPENKEELILVSASNNSTVKIDTAVSGPNHIKITDEPLSNVEMAISTVKKDSARLLDIQENTTPVPENISAAQVDKKDEEPWLEHQKPSRWSFGIVGSPDYSYRKLSENKNYGGGSWGNQYSSLATADPDFSDDIDQLNKADKAKLAYTAGIKAGYKCSAKWQINMGLQHCNKGFKTAVYRIDSSAGSVTGTYYASGSESNFNWASVDAVALRDSIGVNSYGYAIYRYDYYLNQKIKYTDIPLTVQYAIKTLNRFSISASAGMSLNVFTKALIKVHSNTTGSVASAEPAVSYKDFYVSGIVDLNVTYQLSKNIFSEAGFIYRRAITAANKNSMLNVLPFSVGLNAGLSYHF